MPVFSFTDSQASWYRRICGNSRRQNMFVFSRWNLNLYSWRCEKVRDWIVSSSENVYLLRSRLNLQTDANCPSHEWIVLCGMVVLKRPAIERCVWSRVRPTL